MSTPIQSITFKALKLSQPIGEFFVGVIPYQDLCKIAVADVRRLEKERDFETYLGIQRPLNEGRRKVIREYALTLDATFPTSIIIAVSGRCAQWDAKKGELTLREYADGSNEPGDEIIPFGKVANILDGQHRIAGLLDLHTVGFDLNVAIFVEIDIAQQAYIFSTVNQEQTKVNRSLVYDLFALAKTRSPQKTCHSIAVALDQTQESPFFGKIKRLGVATQGRFDETLTQATFVEGILPYISTDPKNDRDQLLRGRKLEKAGDATKQKLIFRNLFIAESDLAITRIILHYFQAIEDKWPHAWATSQQGNIINRTNGFRAFARLLRLVYIKAVSEIGEVPSQSKFSSIFESSSLKDSDFTTDTFPPGTSGESALYKRLVADLV